MKNIFIAFIILLCLTHHAASQSTATPVIPGSLGTSTPYFTQYSSANPLPVSVSTSSISGVIPVANGGTGATSLSSSFSNSGGVFDTSYKVPTNIIDISRTPYSLVPTIQATASLSSVSYTGTGPYTITGTFATSQNLATGLQANMTVSSFLTSALVTITSNTGTAFTATTAVQPSSSTGTGGSITAVDQSTTMATAAAACVTGSELYLPATGTGGAWNWVTAVSLPLNCTVKGEYGLSYYTGRFNLTSGDTASNLSPINFSGDAFYVGGNDANSVPVHDVTVDHVQCTGVSDCLFIDEAGTSNPAEQRIKFVYNKSFNTTYGAYVTNCQDCDFSNNEISATAPGYTQSGILFLGCMDSSVTNNKVNAYTTTGIEMLGGYNILGNKDYFYGCRITNNSVINSLQEGISFDNNSSGSAATTVRETDTVASWSSTGSSTTYGVSAVSVSGSSPQIVTLSLSTFPSSSLIYNGNTVTVPTYVPSACTIFNVSNQTVQCSTPSGASACASSCGNATPIQYTANLANASWSTQGALYSGNQIIFASTMNNSSNGTIASITTENNAAFIVTLTAAQYTALIGISNATAIIGVPFNSNVVANNYVDARGTETYGIGCWGMCYGNTFTGNTVIGGANIGSGGGDNEQNGMQITSLQGINATGSVTGVRYAPSENNTIIGNTIMNGGTLAFYLQNYGGSTFTSYGNAVSNNSVSGGVTQSNFSLPFAAFGNMTISGVNAISFPSLDSGNGSIAIGSSALIGLGTSAAYNATAIGYQAMGNGTLTSAATGNTAVGYKALASLTTGPSNTALGASALGVDTTGHNNAAFGQNSLQNMQSGNNNVAVGLNTCSTITSGNLNTCIGEGAGDHATTTASSNTIIGSLVGSTTLTTGTFNILIGTNAGVDTQAATSSGTLNIGNVIYGTGLGTSSSSPAGAIGIGTATTNGEFQVRTAANENLRVFSNLDLSSGVMLDSVNDAASALQGLELRGSQFELYGGNVGIGTATVLNTLEVNGAASIGYVDISAPVGGMIISGSVGVGTAALGTNAKVAINGGLAVGTYANTAGAVPSNGIDVSGSVYVGTASSAGPFAAYGLSSGAITSDYGCYDTNNGEFTYQASNCTVSLRALKDDIGAYGDGLSTAMRLKPVTFYLKNEHNLGKEIGLIAEDTEAVDKKLAVYDENGILRSVQYDRTGVVAIAAIQDLQREIDAMREQLNMPQRHCNLFCEVREWFESL